jgi:hypothetical protein
MCSRKNSLPVGFRTLVHVDDSAISKDLDLEHHFCISSINLCCSGPQSLFILFIEVRGSWNFRGPEGNQSRQVIDSANNSIWTIFILQLKKTVSDKKASNPELLTKSCLKRYLGKI